MRAIGKRLESLERQLGLVPTGRPMLMVVNLAAKDLSEVVVNTYIRLLKEAGELHGGGFNLVDTTWIPEGINVEEAEKFFRENGLHPSPDWRQREPQAPSNATEAAGPLVRIKRMSASDDSGLPRRYGAMTQ